MHAFTAPNSGSELSTQSLVLTMQSNECLQPCYLQLRKSLKLSLISPFLLDFLTRVHTDCLLLGQSLLIAGAKSDSHILRRTLWLTRAYPVLGK